MSFSIRKNGSSTTHHTASGHGPAPGAEILPKSGMRKTIYKPRKAATRTFKRMKKKTKGKKGKTCINQIQTSIDSFISLSGDVVKATAALPAPARARGYFFTRFPIDLVREVHSFLSVPDWASIGSAVAVNRQAHRAMSDVYDGMRLGFDSTDPVSLTKETLIWALNKHICISNVRVEPVVDCATW